jgi:hypothetical protein
MSSVRGVRRPLSLPRRWMADLMAVSERIPRVALDRTMNLAPLAVARCEHPSPPSWLVLMTKAYAIVAQRTPVLRQAYMSFPWPHLFETNHNIAAVSVAREYQGEPAVFFGKITAPEGMSLRGLSEKVSDWKRLPFERIRSFSRMIRYSRYPLPIRRLAWRLGMNISGRQRAKTVGTFGVSALTNSNCRIVHLLAPTTSSLSFGPVTATGQVEVQLTFDHRVLDGMTAVRALADTEAVLNGELVAELQGSAVRSHVA